MLRRNPIKMMLLLGVFSFFLTRLLSQVIKENYHVCKSFWPSLSKFNMLCMGVIILHFFLKIKKIDSLSSESIS
jgi:uncharacterized membrane protein YhhN